MTAEQWADVEDRWPTRNARIAELIPPGWRVLDLGAGAQGLREWLVDCTYTPADLVPRTPETLPFDMDRGIWPEGRWDVVVLSGVLEYAAKPEVVLRRLHRLAPVAIVTYAHDRSRALRRHPGLFRNAFSEGRFRVLAKQAGWKVRKVDVWMSNIREQVIWRLS